MLSMPLIRKILASGLAAFALLVTVPNVASAVTSPNSGCVQTTRGVTLQYTDPHGNFNLRAYVPTNGWLGVSNRYSIYMYDSAGRQVWAATNQADRTYTIGGNVTKVYLVRNSQQGASTCWARS